MGAYTYLNLTFLQTVMILQRCFIQLLKTSPQKLSHSFKIQVAHLFSSRDYFILQGTGF